MIITFIGHSTVCFHDKIKEVVKEKIRDNIADNETVSCFLGGYGDFDRICAVACRELKSEYNEIELLYITPYISISEQKKINEMQKSKLCDASIYPPIEKVPLRYAILKRNEWMIEKADLVIAFVDKSYGGAFNSLNLAKRKKKRIINICDQI